jgi:SPP1 gp7 family putative phage head morphogenesis protein
MRPALRFNDRARETKRQRQAFRRVRNAERTYLAQLRKVGTRVGKLVGRYVRQQQPGTMAQLTAALQDYSRALAPWARTTARAMLVEVARYDERAWQEHTAGMARAVREEITNAPTGAMLRERLQEQVELITSLPLEAAERVHSLTTQALTDSTRAGEIAKEILRTGEVTENRAKLIARTEVGRTAVELTRARAVHIGSEGYIWRTAGDADVRKSHREMEGKFVAWETPPTLSDGTVTHAGAIYNCRCYPEPVIPETFH